MRGEGYISWIKGLHFVDLWVQFLQLCSMGFIPYLCFSLSEEFLMASFFHMKKGMASFLHGSLFSHEKRAGFSLFLHGSLFSHEKRACFSLCFARLAFLFVLHT